MTHGAVHVKVFSPLLLLLLMFIYLKGKVMRWGEVGAGRERGRERKKKRASICWLTPEVTATDMAGPSPRQESGTPTQCSTVGQQCKSWAYLALATQAGS